MKRLFLVCAFIASLALCSAQSLTTPWTADATAGQGWTEYPRPALVRSEWMNLNGPWDYAITAAASAAPANYAAKILVPYAPESALSGVKKSVLPENRLWYHRSFTLPTGWAGKRILLHFGAVNWDTAVFLNGALVGSHRGAFDPFSFDLTEFLTNGAAQDLVISVRSPSSEGEQPRGKQQLDQSGIWYTPTTGIWQTVWLEPVPLENAIAELRITPDVDRSLVKIAALGTLPMRPQVYAVRVKILDDGSVVAEGSDRIDREFDLSLPLPKLWSPSHPHLYQVSAELVRITPSKGLAPPVARKDPFFGPGERARFAKLPDDAIVVDQVASYFGMRKIALAPGPHGPVIALNGEALFELGPLDQGYWPDGLLTPPTEAAMRFDLDFLKRAGFNLLRKHIKVEPALYYAYCDRIGLMIWQDMPSGMIAAREGSPVSDKQSVRPPDDGELTRSSATQEQFELELRRMIDGLHPYPSIVTWVVFNEGWGQYDAVRLAETVKRLDPTRLVNSASGWWEVGAGDLLDQHTYKEQLDLPSASASRAVVIGEFGGLGYPVPGHLWWTNKRNWGYQVYTSAAELAAQYRKRTDQIAAAISALGLSAGVYTQTTDVEGEVNGLLTYDRRVEKIPAEALAVINNAVIATKR